MNYSSLRFSKLFSMLCILPIMSATAICSENEPSTYTFYLDNDVLFDPLNEDKNYTMGLGFSYSREWTDYFLSKPLHHIDSCIGPNRWGVREEISHRIHSWMFGGTAFTPDDIKNIDPIHEDRPYSSLIQFNTSTLTVVHDQSTAYTTDLTLGILGLYVAREVQTCIHEKMTCSPTPNGWEHQISNGGEFTGLYRVRANWLWSPEPMDFLSVSPKPDCHQISFSTEGAVGYYTYLSAGPTFRLGYITTPFWCFDSNPMAMYNKAETGKNLSKIPSNWSLREFFIYCSLKGTAVAYNAHLQGQFRESEIIYTGSEIERFLYEYQAGISFTIWSLSFTYAISGRSKEFKGDMAGSHIWGGLYLNYRSN